MIFVSILRALYCMSFGAQRLGFRGEIFCQGQLAHKNNEFFTPQKLPAIWYVTMATKCSIVRGIQCIQCYSIHIILTSGMTFPLFLHRLYLNTGTPSFSAASARGSALPLTSGTVNTPTTLCPWARSKLYT